MVGRAQVAWLCPGTNQGQICKIMAKKQRNKVRFLRKITLTATVPQR